MLPIKKVYVDSKYKTEDSASDSDFKFELGQSITLPDDAKFFISDCCIPHSWKTVEYWNNKLYLKMIDETNSANTNYYVIELEQKTYNGTTLATEIKNKIVNATGLSSGVNFTYSVQTNILSGNIIGFTAVFLTDKELQDESTNFTAIYDVNNLQSANGIICNTSKFSDPFTSIQPLNTPLQLQPIRNVYIHSNLGSFSTLGARGEQDIVKKVPVNNNFSEMIFSDYNAGEADMLDCGKQTLRQLHFRITNIDGIVIPLHDNHVSFSIIFHV